MTFEELKKLKQGTILVLHKGCRAELIGFNNKKDRVIVYIEDEDAGVEYIEKDVKNWKVEPSQNTITLYECMDRCGNVLYVNRKGEFPRFHKKEFIELSDSGVLKRKTGRTCKLDLNTWEVSFE